MCWCTPEIRTPFCGKANCVPPQPPKIPMAQLITKSIEQRQLDELEGIHKLLGEIVVAGAKLWPNLFNKEETLVQAARKEKKRK